MKRRYENAGKDWKQFQNLIGLGDDSARKSYYPALKQTIADLKHEKEKFERIFSHALSGIFQSTLGGELIIVNPAMATICGYKSPEELLTTIKNIQSQLFIKPEEFRGLIGRLEDDGFVVDHEARFRRKDNDVIIVSLNVRLNETLKNRYLEFFFQDITERKRNEEELKKHREHLEELILERTAEIEKAHRALQESEERFRSLSEASFEGVVLLEDIKIVEANKAMGKMSGVSSEELIGRDALELFPPEEQERVKKKIVSGNEKPYESTALRKDGSTFPMEVQARMFSYKGQQVRVLAVRDLTEQKRAEEEIKILRGSLPICASCKKIRDDKGYWNQIEAYIQERSEAEFSHGLCPQCAVELYPQMFDEYGNMLKKK